MEVQAGTFNPADFSWQGLTMTPAAAAHIRDLMRKQPDKKGLRLGIKTSGCAGFGYVLEMIAEPAADDLLFEHDGAKLWAPLQAMPFIDGTELDYVREGLNESFKFHNPKAQHECGCVGIQFQFIQQSTAFHLFDSQYGILTQKNIFLI